MSSAFVFSPLPAPRVTPASRPTNAHRNSIRRMKLRSFLASAAVLSLAAPLFAADAPQRTDEEILKTVKVPDGYEATVFAKPPEGGYPVQLSAAIDGTIFVAVDENGSLGRDRNEKGKARGKVVRMRDTNGDGKADEFKVFCEVESPRGVIWDGNGMSADGKMPGKLYVMHPPNLTVYTDVDGDGTADTEEDILKGLGFGLDFRGADHTTNGCRLGIDGFIYIAVGDYGFTKAVAKDGTTLSNRGGGIVRIRPDGTGFEIVSRGQRNILDVAISPTLDLFTRDNTNDGGNWNVRLSFIPPGAHMGYPYFFKNFAEDNLDALADFGGGSPCGSLWLDEPGLPKGLFTVEWGAGGIFYHDDLEPNGAGWKLKNADASSSEPVWKRPASKQTPWLKLVRPTDMDVDASGRLYITSWEGATFNYNGPFAGYVLRVVKKDAPKVNVPDLAKLSPGQLAIAVTSQSDVLRLAAQREIIRRGEKSAPLGDLEKLASTPLPIAGRIAALETLKQTAGSTGWPHLLKLGNDPAIRANIYRAIGDLQRDAAMIPTQTITAVINDADPRVRAAAITALRRLHKADAANNILPLVADSDIVVAHLAVRALSELKAVQACLGALDSADAKVQPGALRALYAIYEPAVVDGLISRLATAKGDLRRGILNALCRLSNQDAPYEDPKVWWGTRPDTSGPVYQPIAWSETEKINGALKAALEKSDGEEGKWLVTRMYQCKVNLPGLVELMFTKAGGDTPSKLTAIEGMIRQDNSLPEEAVNALKTIATNDKEAPELRARALRLLQRCAESGTVFPGAVAAFAALAGHDLPHAALTSAFEDFTRDAKNGKWVRDYAKLLGGKDAAQRQLAATVLVNFAPSRLGKEQDRKIANEEITKAWAKPESAAALLAAIARTNAKSFADQVEAHLKDPNNAVAEAALFAHQKLGLGQAGGTAKQIGTLQVDAVLTDVVAQKGDGAKGREIFLRAGCIACHTVAADEPPKGPMLAAVANIYGRKELAESILKPNAKIAQGFETQWFDTAKGEHVEGFVTREGGDSVDVRNIAGQSLTLEKGDIKQRGKRETSMMPEGLMNGFTPAELSDLLSYLESLKKK